MNDIQKLRYWTFKILPLVYDDSLSYYEVLAKVTSKINELVQYNNDLNENIAQTVIDQVKTELDSDELATKVFDTLAGAIATDEGDTTYTPNNKTGGELVWINGTLYKVTKKMVTGELYTVGTNIETVKIANELALVKKYLTGTHNQYWNTQASESYDTGIYLFWQDTLYKTTKDIALNDILATSGNGANLTEVDLGTEITDHYFEMKEADENLQTQIDNNENDIETKMSTANQNISNLQTNLNNEITTRTADINELKTSTLLILGDSWTDSSSTYGGPQIVAALQAYYTNVYSYGVGGAVISNISSQATRAKNAGIQPTEIFIICGTNNAFHHQQTTVTTDEINAMASVRSTFPKIPIHYFPDNAWSYNGYNCGPFYYSLIQNFSANGIIPHPESLVLLMGAKSWYRGTDTALNIQHLTDNGATRYAQAIYAMSRGGIVWPALQFNSNKYLADLEGLTYDSQTLTCTFDSKGTGTSVLELTNTASTLSATTQLSIPIITDVLDETPVKLAHRQVGIVYLNNTNVGVATYTITNSPYAKSLILHFPTATTLNGYTWIQFYSSDMFGFN